ncbi:MAG: AfsR/SARP family transcriptional regulator [Acidimicrobiales bacterium]
MTHDIRIRLSGVLAVEIDGVAANLSPLGRLAALAFGHLVAERGRAVSRDELADVVWNGKPPATWPHALRNTVNRVRRALPDVGVVASTAGCYSLRLARGAVVDVEEAAAALDLARREQSVAAARRAVALSTSPFLAGLGGEWVEGRQARLAEFHLDAQEVLSEAARRAGDDALAVASAAEAVALQPLRETAHLRLMQAHEAAGNRAEALRAYERCRRTLADEIGVDPSPAMEAAYLALVAEASWGPGRLAYPITSFIGRVDEVAAVDCSLRSSRLVSLVGIGGIGKSRLALEVAARAEARFPDGVFLVELAGLRDPSLVAAEVLASVGGRPAGPEPTTDLLVRRLAAGHSLLVLDNCEHLAGACAELARSVLRRCPNVRILATTRAPLGVAGETTWTVPPLAPTDAVRLFAERSGAPHDDDGAVAVARRLDGIPLAIELAAGWARTLSPADIAARLDDRFELLAPLRSTLDWSYEALSPQEAQSLRGLSVFAGAFTLAAAAALSPLDEMDLLRALSTLVDRCLVVVDRARRPLRYRQLETVREYASARLAEAGAAREWQRRLLVWAVGLAEATGEQNHGLDTLDAEHDNLRAALADAADPELGGRLAVALGRFWEVRGYWAEGRSQLAVWTNRSDVPARIRANALNAAANLAQHQRDYDAARSGYAECLAIRTACNDELGAAAARHGLASIAFLASDLDGARASFSENLEVARRHGASAVEAASLLNLGVIEQSLAMRGMADGTTASKLLLQALDASRRLGDRQRVALALENLGTLAAFLGDDAEARSRLEASIVIRREIGDRAGIAVSLRALTRVALRQDDCDRARALADEYVAIERGLGRPYDTAEALAVRAEVATKAHDDTTAIRLLDQSVELHQGMGDGAAPQWIVAARTAAVARSVTESGWGSVARRAI